MSVLSHLAPVAIGALASTKLSWLALAAKWSAVAGLATAVVVLLRNRRAFAGIAQLDQAGLRDIGLTPGDVYYARSLPLWEDPTAELASRAGARRGAKG